MKERLRLTDLTYIRTGLPHWLSPKPPSGPVTTPVITDADLEMVFDRIAEGHYLTTILDDCPHLPPRRLLMRLINSDPELQNRYVEARTLSAMLYEEKALRTADDESSDLPEDVVRSKLKVTTYMWAAAINDPKRYAPQKNVNLTTNIDLTSAMDRAEKRVNGSRVIEHEG